MCALVPQHSFSAMFLLVLLWADQLSSLSVVDIRPCCTVEPWPSSIIFTFMVDPGSQPISSSSPPATVVSSPGNARSTRSQSVQSIHPPPRPLPIHNWPPSRPPRGESELARTFRSRAATPTSRTTTSQPIPAAADAVIIEDTMMNKFEAPRPRSAPGIMPPRPRP